MSRVNGFDVSILGDAALTKVFQGLERKVAGKVLRPALRVAAKRIRDVARANAAPGLTGATSEHIRVKGSSKKGRLAVQVVTGSREDMGIPADAKYYYPSAVELGTEKMEAQPFLRPALDANRAAALGMIRAESWRRLELLGLGRDPGGEGSDA